MVESDLNLHKNYMAMKSTWNRTCFPNPPGCCMYRLPYEQVGSDIRGSRWVAFLLSVSWNWHLHTASGQCVLILFISHSRGDGYPQCLCLEQLKIRQTSSGRVVLFHTIVVVHDSRVCNDLEPRSHLQGQGHIAHIPKINVLAKTPHCQLWSG